MSVVGGNETPFVLAYVVNFTTHVIITSDYIDFVLEQETLVRHSQLIHRVKVLPGFGRSVEKMDFSISISVLTANEDDFIRRNRKGTAGPQRIL